MRFLLVICFIAAWSTSSYSEELRLLMDTTETWLAREIPATPANDREKLAYQAVSTQDTVSNNMMTAHYLGPKDSFELVTVDEAPDDESGGIHAVISYQFRDGKIWSATRLKYTAQPPLENEQIAREIALDYLLGRIGPIPVMFHDHVFVPVSDGKCIISITEKDDSAVHFTYRYSRCKQP